MRAFNFMGDTTICSGEWVDKRMDGSRYVVDLKVEATNQRGEVTSPGTATVVLRCYRANAVRYCCRPRRKRCSSAARK